MRDAEARTPSPKSRATRPVARTLYEALHELERRGGPLTREERLGTLNRIRRRLEDLRGQLAEVWLCFVILFPELPAA